VLIREDKLKVGIEKLAASNNEETTIPSMSFIDKPLL